MVDPDTVITDNLQTSRTIYGDKPRCSWCMIGYSLMAFPKSKKDGNNKQKHKGNLG